MVYIILSIVLIYNLLLLRRHVVLLKMVQHESKLIRSAIFNLTIYSAMDLTTLHVMTQKLEERLEYIESTITCVPSLREVYMKIITPKNGGEIGQ